MADHKTDMRIDARGVIYTTTRGGVLTFNTCCEKPSKPVGTLEAVDLKQLDAMVETMYEMLLCSDDKCTTDVEPSSIYHAWTIKTPPAPPSSPAECYTVARIILNGHVHDQNCPSKIEALTL